MQVDTETGLLESLNASAYLPPHTDVMQHAVLAKKCTVAVSIDLALCTVVSCPADPQQVYDLASLQLPLV